MARTKKSDAEMVVKKDGVVSDGVGDFLPKGATFTPSSAEAAASLREKGYAD